LIGQDVKMASAVDGDGFVTTTGRVAGNDEEPGRAGTGQGIHVVAKPIGPICNLDCKYCFYLEKQALFAPDERFRMTDEVLSALLTNYLTSQPTPVVEFVWQGGEPTLLGIDFFKRVVDRLPSHARRQPLSEEPPHARVCKDREAAGQTSSTVSL
jgi:hypothetical protein